MCGTRLHHNNIIKIILDAYTLLCYLHGVEKFLDVGNMEMFQGWK